MPQFKQTMLKTWFSAGLLFLGLALSPPATAQTPPPGDLNKDGRVSVSDVVLALRHTVGLINLEAALLPKGDVAPTNADGSYGDGEILLNDVVKILRRASGLDSSLIWPGSRYFRDPVPVPDVSLGMPREPLYVGSYVYVPVRINSASGLTLDDIDFKLPDGPPSGMVSLSKDKFFSPKEPTVMLGAGYRPGTYMLQAFKKGTATLLAEGKYEITSLWKREREGPSIWFNGITREYLQGGAWGGGTTGPQNVDTNPASGTRRIAILLVDTSSQRYPSDAATITTMKNDLLDAIVNGVASGGVTRSSDLFFREVSYGNFNLSAQAFGPVSLAGDFDTYFNSNGSPKGSYYQSAMTAGDSLINFNNFDTILCVSEDVPASGGTAGKAAWPYASIGHWGPYTTEEGNFNLGVISMPKDWTALDGRDFFATFSHELGHNIGLGDQYTPDVPGRNVGRWDLMHADGDMPHFSVAHRMMLGWAEPSWIRSFDFASIGVPVDQTVTLHPIELGAPPAGRSTGVEIRVADGWNYYLEYRNNQVTQIGDQGIPLDQRVLMTDVISSGFEAPIARPRVLLVPNDPDGDGSVLDTGTDYRETDFSDPTYPTDFQVDVTAIDENRADVRIRYGVNSKPDPSIRPWPASASRQWQSPDIEVKNDRNQADPAWFNVPWEGNPNTVVAKVKNNGNLAAPGVRVNFYVKDYNVGGTPETFLGSDIKDIPANGTVEFTTGWVPPREGHFCIIVRIPLYQVPGATPAVIEMTELNNLAQSTYTRFISRSASPATREVTEISVGNPYPKTTLIHLIPGQNNPLYRTYVEHAWLIMDPGEVRKVKVMFEYAGEDYLQLAGQIKDPEASRRIKEEFDKYRRVPNRMGLRSVIENPFDEPRHSIDLLGGVESEIVEGRKTDFARFSADGDSVVGLVVTASDKKPAPSGQILLTLEYPDEKLRTVRLVNQHVSLQQGQFAAKIRSGWLTVRAYYLPPPGIADATSETLKNPAVTDPPIKTPEFPKEPTFPTNPDTTRITQ